MIIKVQRPMMSNSPLNPWLLYNKTRRYEASIPDTEIPANLKQMMGNEYKIYCEASIVHGSFVVSRKVEPQDW